MALRRSGPRSTARTPTLIPFGFLIAVLGGWLIVGPILYPLWSSGTIEPYGSEGMKALRWLGQVYGPGGLLLYLAGCAHGLLSRRTVVEDAEVEEPEPQAHQTVTAGT